MKQSFLNGLKNGFISSFTSAIITQPFQVISTNLIVNTYNERKRKSLLHIIKYTYNKEGISGFYRGFTAATLKNIVGSSIYFACLEHFMHVFRKYDINKVYVNMISASIARAVQVVVVCPLNVIKTRFEVHGFNSYDNTLDAFRKIYIMEGMKGYFKGMRSVLVKEVPYSAMFYTIYEYSKKKMHSMKLITNMQMASAIASLLSVGILTLLTNPLEVIRTRLQYQFFSQKNEHNYRGILQGVYTISKMEGMKGLMSGMVPVFLKKGTAGLVVWTLYDTLKVRRGKSGL